ncbi:MAG: hypothetical protein V7643_2759, partial [Mycobacterium sp.]
MRGDGCSDAWNTNFLPADNTYSLLNQLVTEFGPSKEGAELSSFTALQKSIKAEARYYLPEVRCSSTARINPDYPTIYERNSAWVMEFLPFDNKEEMEHLLERRYPMWDSLIYPDGLPDRVFLST